MATVTRENIGTLHDKITVKLSKEDYLPSFEKSLKHYAKNANVPGFRKGNVPGGMIKKMYGQSLFNDEILRSAGQQLEDYLKNEKLEIFAQPMIMPGEATQSLNMNNPADVDFSFEVGLKPDFEIASIKNKAKLTRYKIEISDKMLNDELERISRRYGTVEELETVATNDDIIYSSFEHCESGGESIEGAEKIDDTSLLEKLPVKLQEMLKGKKKNDTIIVMPPEIAEGDELVSFLKMPLKTDMQHAQQHYKMTITKVGKLIPKELDAALFTEVFPNDEITTEEAFKEKIKAELSKEYDRIAHDRMSNEIYEMLVHNTSFQLPVPFLKRWMKEGQEQPKPEADVEKEFPSFDHQLRWTLISDKLIQDNNINVSHEEVKDEIKKQVLGYFSMGSAEDAPWLDSYMAKIEKDEKMLNETYRRMLYDKLFKFLETQFSVDDKMVTEEEFFKLPDAHAAHHHH